MICAGEGARARHAYMIAQDLGLPAGMLSMLGDSISDQNALIISALLMDRGAVNVPISLVPTLLTAGTPVVTSGMPPFDWWQPPPPGPGRIPIYRTDAGAFLIAEAFGAQTVIYVKDQDGLYTQTPPPTPTPPDREHHCERAARPRTTRSAARTGRARDARRRPDRQTSAADQRARPQMITRAVGGNRSGARSPPDNHQRAARRTSAHPHQAPAD